MWRHFCGNLAVNLMYVLQSFLTITLRNMVISFRQKLPGGKNWQKHECLYSFVLTLSNFKLVNLHCPQFVRHLSSQWTMLCSLSLGEIYLSHQILLYHLGKIFTVSLQHKIVEIEEPNMMLKLQIIGFQLICKTFEFNLLVCLGCLCWTKR